MNIPSINAANFTQMTFGRKNTRHNRTPIVSWQVGTNGLPMHSKRNERSDGNDGSTEIVDFTVRG